MNVTFGLIEDSSHSPVRDKQVRRQQMVDRALAATSAWKAEIQPQPAQAAGAPC